MTDIVSTAPVRLGTRRSQLALWQANWVAGRLRHRWPGLEIERVEIVTEGDRILDRPLSEVGGKGLFVNGIEDRLLAGTVDFAVHSMKDLPSAVPDRLALVATPKRADPRDALVGPAGTTLPTLEPGTRVGTSSLRRTALVRRINPSVEVISIRGNVPTRLRAIEQGVCDAVILAAAGLDRLGLGATITERLDPELFCPAAAQGILAIECRADDTRMRALLEPLDDPNTAVVASTERAFLARLEGGCQVPMGCHAVLEADEIRAQGFVADPAGRPLLFVRDRALRSDARALGTSLAERLIDLGADEILSRLADGQP